MSTLEAISEQAGVSYRTAADILSPRATSKHRYSKTTQEHVTRIARELGYRPNSGAQALATGRFNAVSLILSSYSVKSYLPTALLTGIIDALETRGQHLNVAKMDDRVLTDATFMPRVLREMASDGLLVNYTNDAPPEFESLLLRHQLPAVWINSNRDVDCVRPNDFQAGLLLADHLLQLGHRRIVYFCGFHSTSVFPRLHYSAGDRIRGYEFGMSTAGTLAQVVRRKDGEDCVDIAIALLRQESRPTAAVCETPHDVEAMMIAARVLNLSVPRDLSLALVHGEPTHCTNQPITIARIRSDIIGAEAVAMLAQRIEQPQSHESTRVIAAELLQGETTARVSN